MLNLTEGKRIKVKLQLNNLSVDTVCNGFGKLEIGGHDVKENS